MCAKFEAPTVEMFRLPQDETPQPFAGWSSEAQRLQLGATRTKPSIASVLPLLVACDSSAVRISRLSKPKSSTSTIP
jgi:hypothetical protein